MKYTVSYFKGDYAGSIECTWDEKDGFSEHVAIDNLVQAVKGKIEDNYDRIIITKQQRKLIGLNRKPKTVGTLPQSKW